MERTIAKIHNGLMLDGRSETVGATAVRVYLKDVNGNVVLASGTSVPTGAGYAKSCLFVKTDAGSGTKGLYENTGTTASASFDLVGSIASADISDNAVTTAKIADANVTPAKYIIKEARTATADGLTTGIVGETTTHVIVTSGAATDQITLPSGAAGNVGKTLTIWVGANGFELITPAASNATINNVDSDGTNQADIPANTLCELHLVDTNTWLLRANSNLGAVVTAIIPDND